MNVLTAAFSELADYARNTSDRHGTYAAAVVLVDCLSGRERKLVLVRATPVKIPTDRYEVVLRAKLYRNGLLYRNDEPNRN